MPSFLPSNPETILPLIVQKLLNDNVFANSSLCYLTDAPESESDAYYPPGGQTQYATIAAGNASRTDAWEGPVRAFLHMRQDVLVTVWTRWGVDTAGQATRIMTDARGILAKVTQVVNSLHGLQVLDASGNLLSSQPVILEREDRLLSKKKNEEWSRRTLTFSLYFQRNTALPAVVSAV